jgi:signal transduction histidine kinase
MLMAESAADTFPAVNPPWSLRRRVAALCLLAALLLAFLAAGGAITAAANQGRLTTLIDDIGPMRTAADDLMLALVNQESGVLRYVVNHNAADLTPYEDGVEQERLNEIWISQSPATTQAIRDGLTDVAARASRWREGVAKPAIAAVNRHDFAAATALMSEPAWVQFEQVREAAEKLRSTMVDVRNTASTGIRDASSTLVFVLLVAAVMVIAAGIALMITLQRLVIGPVTDLATQVRAVARGTYDQQIRPVGPPELEHLGRDVDLMRRQIASDLAEVEAARRQIEASNAALEQQAAELVRSNRDLEQFAYVASHDLQEPLRKVASFCQLLQRRYADQLDERAQQYIEFAVNGAQRMQRLINDLLAFSRIGRDPAGFIDVDLARLVADAARVHEDDGADVRWTDLPVVHGEEALLGTLLTNLIGNAVKFRRPDVPAEVRISSTRVGDMWHISCADNGIGVARESAQQVFVIFQRLHPRDSYPGTGIGLAVAKKIVEYHGGEIWLEPDVADGTTVTFTLPVRDDGEAATSRAILSDSSPVPA